MLKGLRVGCVKYLNSKPLIHGLSEVRLAHPSVLAAELRRGELDAALVPVFELLRSPQDYWAVDGVAIASRGPVYSVFVAYRGSLEDIETLWVDPASLTSVHLVQVLFDGVLGRKVPLVSEPGNDVGSRKQARLLIGNQAICFRQQQAGQGWSYWDLGEVWGRWTGLPFVYALWVIRRGIPNLNEVASALREVAKVGVAQVDAIAARQDDVPFELARVYLREHISFELGEPEKNGLERFRRELIGAGFLQTGGSGIAFVSDRSEGV